MGHIMSVRFLAFSLLVISFSALAEELVLDTVQIIGNKEGRTYSETPESVTILPASRINRGDQSNSLEVLNGQSNVQVTNTRTSENFSIRGVNSTGVTGFQKDNLASVFVDDVFQTDLAMRAGGFEVWDIESLEIHRGPQSTSQGVNSLAGAIILQHYAPHQENEAALKLGYGSYNRREVGAILNRAFFNKKFATRLSFNKDANDGFITNKTTGNEKWGRQDKGHLAADFKYFFDDKSELRFNNKFLRTDNGGNYTIGSDPQNYEVFEDQDSRSVTDNQQNSVQYVRPINAQWSNKTTLAYTKGHQRNKGDADGTPTSSAGTRYEFSRDQFISFENVITFKNDRIKNALGVHAHQYRSFNNYDFSILISSIPVQVVQDLDKQRETYAIFDSLLYKINAHHALNLGGRYEFVKNEYGSYVNPLTVTGNATIDNYLNSVRGSYDGDHDTQVFLPKVGYIYTVGKQTLGATYSQGYRIGGLDINRSQAKTVKYDPERTDNYELSWKYVSDKVKTQVNAFYTYWKDQQVEVQLSTTDTYNSQVENASTSELYGAEFESTYQFENGNSLRAGLGHVQTHFLGFNNNGKSFNGKEFPDAAKWTAQTAYNHLFNDRINGNSTLRYVGKSYTNAENSLKSPEQYYLDLNLQYVTEKFIWELNAKNVTDQAYTLSKSKIYDNYYQRVNRPRELGTRVTFFW